MEIKIKVQVKHGSPQQSTFTFTIDEDDTLIPLNPEDRIMDATTFNNLLGKVLALKALMERTTITNIEIEKEA